MEEQLMTNGLKKILTWLVDTSFLLASLCVASCNDTVGPGEEKPEATSYVAFATRAHGIGTSINTDSEDFEDLVSTVRLMAFDHASGELKHNAKYTPAYLGSNKIPMKIGTYDFYFVANETSVLTAALDRVQNYDDLHQVEAITRIPFDKVTDKPKANEFLMTAIVENQTVSATHVATNPLLVSVLLIRTLAKVSLKIRYYDKERDQEGVTEATNGLMITRIAVNNIPETYSLFPPKSPYAGAMKASSQALDISTMDPVNSTVYTAHFYIPEYLRAAGAPNDGNSSITISYTKHGINRTKTAVLDHFEEQTSDHYKPANWNELTHYSVIRNTHYSLTTNIIGWEEEAISFNWEILPWTVHSSIKDFSQIKIENITGEVNRQPGIEAADKSNIILMRTGATQQLELKFKVLSPQGAVWRFTITNTLDFDLIGSPSTSGIAGEQEIKLIIRSLKPWTGNIRSTELYLTINGQEVQIVPEFIEQDIKPGPTKRYMLQQII